MFICVCVMSVCVKFFCVYFILFVGMLKQVNERMYVVQFSDGVQRKQQHAEYRRR